MWLGLLVWGEGEVGNIVNPLGMNWESRDFREYNQEKLGLYNNKLKCVLIKNLVTVHSK